MEELILPFPVQNSLTRAMRAAAAKQGFADYQSLWAGQGVTRCREISAPALIDSLF
jgi:nitronate monooxygenase